MQPQVTVPMMASRHPGGGGQQLPPHHLAAAQQRFMMPGQFPSQPPPLVGHTHGRAPPPQDSHLPPHQGGLTSHPPGLVPLHQASPRPPGGGGEDVHGYRREYLEGGATAGVMYGTMAMAGCQEVGEF